MTEQVMRAGNRLTEFWLALNGQKARADEKNEAEPSLSDQIQIASDALELARQQFDAETDFDRIDSHIYLMQAMENRLNSLFLQAKKEQGELHFPQKEEIA